MRSYRHPAEPAGGPEDAQSLLHRGAAAQSDDDEDKPQQESRGHSDIRDPTGSGVERKVDGTTDMSDQMFKVGAGCEAAVQQGMSMAMREQGTAGTACASG